MSLSLKFLITPKLTSYQIEDNTGDYDALNNPGGWGNVNPDRDDITEANLTLTNPDGTIFTTDLVDSDFPTVYDTVTLQNQSGLVYTDGVFNFAFNLVTGSSEYNVEYDILQINNLKCMLSKLALQNKLDDYKTFKLLYDRINYAFECDNYTLVADLLTEVSRLSESCNCGC